MEVGDRMGAAGLREGGGAVDADELVTGGERAGGEGVGAERADGGAEGRPWEVWVPPDWVKEADPAEPTSVTNVLREAEPERE